MICLNVCYKSSRPNFKSKSTRISVQPWMQHRSVWHASRRFHGVCRKIQWLSNEFPDIRGYVVRSIVIRNREYIVGYDDLPLVDCCVCKTSLTLDAYKTEPPHSEHVTSTPLSPSSSAAWFAVKGTAGASTWELATTTSQEHPGNAIFVKQNRLCFQRTTWNSDNRFKIDSLIIFIFLFIVIWI